jgi:hypothetical protein
MEGAKVVLYSAPRDGRIRPVNIDLVRMAAALRAEGGGYHDDADLLQ